MKKISALLIIMVLVVSLVPAAFAQGTLTKMTAYGSEEDSSDNISGEDSDESLVADSDDLDADSDDPDDDSDGSVGEDSDPEPVEVKARERVRKPSEDRPLIQARERLKENVAKLKALQERQGERWEERPAKPLVEKAKEKLAMAKENYQKARQRYVSAKEAYREKRQTFNQAKEKLQACKDSDSEECADIRNKLKGHAPDFLLKSADLVLKEIERVKAKVEASEDLTEEEVEEILSNLEETKVEVEAAKEVIEDLDEDSSKEEVNEAAKTIREAWSRTKVRLKKSVGNLANAKLGNILLKIEKLEERFYRTRDRLAEQGEDVSKLDAVLEDFSAKLDEAADKYTKAKEVWAEAKTAGDVDEAAKEVHDLLVEAKGLLQESKELLRDAVVEIRRLNQGSLDIVDEDSEEDAEETAEEKGAVESDEGDESGSEEDSEESA